MLQLYICFGMIFHFSLVPEALIGFTTSCFGLKYLFWSIPSQIEMIQNCGWLFGSDFHLLMRHVQYKCWSDVSVFCRNIKFWHDVLQTGLWFLNLSLSTGFGFLPPRSSILQNVIKCLSLLTVICWNYICVYVVTTLSWCSGPVEAQNPLGQGQNKQVSGGFTLSEVELCLWLDNMTWLYT